MHLPSDVLICLKMTFDRFYVKNCDVNKKYEMERKHFRNM